MGALVGDGLLSGEMGGLGGEMGGLGGEMGGLGRDGCLSWRWVAKWRDG
jgi:hypothetical protein